MRKSGAVFDRVLRLAGAVALLTGLLAPGGAAFAQSAPAAGAAPKRLNDMVDKYCVKCHNATDWAGNLAMDTLDLAHPAQDQEAWETAIAKLRGRLMPPAGENQPPQPDVDAVVAYLENTIDSSAAEARRVGHVGIQRLNRVEFGQSVKSLLGVDIDPKQFLPTEIEVEGFNNIAGALSVSPSFMEQYLSAARKVARSAVGEPQPRMATLFYKGGGGGGGQAGPGFGQWTHHDGMPLGTRGGLTVTHTFPADGDYRFNFMDGDSIDAGLYPRGMETSATLVILVDGKEVGRREIGGPDDLALADRDGPPGREKLVAKVNGITAHVPAGEHEVTATFIERSWALSNDPTGSGAAKMTGMPIIRDGIQIVGPFAPKGLSLSESRAKIFVCHPKDASEEPACAEKIARSLATKAFRRPATDADVKLLMKFYENGRKDPGGFDAGVTELVTAVLSSPDFLYRAIKSAPANGAPRQLNDLELASRLSFFLWNEGPDQTLIDLATQHKLTDTGVLDAQVARMLKDPRAQSLVENFALSWLNLDELEQVEPLDPAFNSAMRKNFETEIRLFLSSVLLENRSVMDLLNANWTFLNESLARQYGISDVFGPQFRRVVLKDENRWGLLGKGAVLLRTSYGDRTSPVLRGAWVLDRIVGTPPTPPPPGVVTDLSIHEGQKPTTVRARLENHRANATCNGCHGLIDPPGLALENFDVTGKWRDVDALSKDRIDASVTLTSGLKVSGPAELRRFLTSHADQFPTTVTRRLMMYALNREVEYFEMPEVRRIVRDAAASNYSFASLVTGVVNSDSFRRQGAESKEPKKEAPPIKKASADVRGANVTAQRQEK